MKNVILALIVLVLFGVPQAHAQHSPSRNHNSAPHGYRVTPQYYNGGHWSSSGSPRDYTKPLNYYQYYGAGNFGHNYYGPSPYQAGGVYDVYGPYRNYYVGPRFQVSPY